MRQFTLPSALLILANILIPLSCVIFSSGFFPYKPFIPGLAEYEPLLYDQPPPAPFNKVIFMIVDALRSDFVFSRRSGFDFTQSLITRGLALPFTAHASAPTVTMPRIKALTTGSIPSFVDMILNVAESDTSSTLTTQDNWLAQMLRNADGKAIMYGDDTWLKLFPDTFARADGTSSFFVADFTEVDNNVTRHIPSELANQDWNIMILHYLGLDHIGHKSGPYSHNMLPKQREMDGVVKLVYEAIESEQHLESTLFVLAGDHGMNDGGNHGGSAPGETSPALVFISPKLKSISHGLPCPIEPENDFDYYERVQQSDLTPTLAGLLGFPIPLNNLGIILAPFLQLWQSDDDRVQLLLRNAVQILNIVKAKFSHPIFSDSDATVSCEGYLSEEEELACAWKDATDAVNLSTSSAGSVEAANALLKFCRLAQKVLSSTASNYNVSSLWIGISAVSLALILSGIISAARLGLQLTVSGIVFIISGSAYLAMMFASSFVEEEQQFWYWITSAWMSVQLVRRNGAYRRPSIIILILLRLGRRWNQSGSKYAGAIDIAKGFVKSYDYGMTWGRPVLWILIATTYLELGRILYRGSFKSSGLSKPVAAAATIIIVVISAAFKVFFAAHDAPELLGPALKPVLLLSQYSPSLIMLARMSFTMFGISVVLIGFTKSNNGDYKRVQLRLYPVMQHFLILQTRTTSIPLLLLLHIIIVNIPSLHLQGHGIAFTGVALAKFAYFSFGGTNAISSLDLSLSYNGISSYDPIAVGGLLLVSNFGTAITSSVAVIAGFPSSMQTSRTTDITSDLGTYAKSSVTNGPKHRTRAKLIELEGAEDRTGDKGPSNNANKEAMTMHLDVMSLWISLETLAVMAGCTWLREHLFVWTVFSPRFLYQAAWVLGWHVLGNLGLGYFVHLTD